MKLGSFDVLVLNNYKTIKEALIKKRRVFSGRPAFDSLKNVSQGRSIVFNDSHTMGEAWMQKKQLVIKLLHKFVVGHDTRELLCRQVTAETLQMVSQLDQLCRRSPTGCVEPEGTIQVGIANLVCAMMFGHRYEYSNKVSVVFPSDHCFFLFLFRFFLFSDYAIAASKPCQSYLQR